MLHVPGPVSELPKSPEEVEKMARKMYRKAILDMMSPDDREKWEKKFEKGDKEESKRERRMTMAKFALGILTLACLFALEGCATLDSPKQATKVAITKADVLAACVYCRMEHGYVCPQNSLRIFDCLKMYKEKGMPKKCTEIKGMPRK